MVHLILTGATGLIGSGVLQQMLSNEAVSRISILSRRPVKMAEGHEDRAKVIIHKDFKQYDQALLDELKDAQGCVWALGVSQNDVDKVYAFPHLTNSKLTSYVCTAHMSKSRTIIPSLLQKPSPRCDPKPHSLSSTYPAKARHTHRAGSRPYLDVSRDRQSEIFSISTKRILISRSITCARRLWIGGIIPKSTPLCRNYLCTGRFSWARLIRFTRVCQHRQGRWGRY